jgi:hypothetical protein
MDGFLYLMFLWSPFWFARSISILWMDGPYTWDETKVSVIRQAVFSGLLVVGLVAAIIWL